jgi:protein-disulfide isomerase
MALVPVGPDDHILGESHAPVTLIEYGDYQCRVCAMAYGLVNRLLEHFGDNVRFVFRHFPISKAHPQAQAAAETAEFAALHGHFWQMHDLLYRSTKPLERSTFVEFAELLHLSQDQLAEALEQHTLQAKVLQSFEGGVLSGVNGLPTFFVNGQRYEGPPERLGLHIEKLLS